jgi:hypothetical protein
VTLLIILVLVTLVLFALFLGGSLVAQGYLYQAPADHLPLRALAGALLVGLFVTFWVWIDKRNPRKYDTFFEFAPYETKTFDEFEAVRWVSPDGTRFKVDAAGNKVEVPVKFHRGVGGKSSTFFDEKTGTEFKMNGVNKTNESFMTAAILVKPEANGEPVRFNARLGPDKRSYAKGDEGRRFDEEKGSRYVQADLLGVMFVPSNMTVFLALVLNLVHFVIWFVAFWLILHFTRGHAFVLAVSFGLITMILVMPLLFRPNRTPPAPQPPPAVAGRNESRIGIVNQATPGLPYTVG